MISFSFLLKISEILRKINLIKQEENPPNIWVFEDEVREVYDVSLVKSQLFPYITQIKYNFFTDLKRKNFKCNVHSQYTKCLFLLSH